MRAANQGTDRAPEGAGDETTTLRGEPTHGAEMAVPGGDGRPSEVLLEADDRALEEAGYGHGV